MEHFLTTRRFTELLECHPIGIECPDRCSGQLLNGMHAGCELVPRSIQDVSGGRLGDYQMVTVSPRHDIHERVSSLILIKLYARKLSTKNPGEYVVGIVVHGIPFRRWVRFRNRIA